MNTEKIGPGSLDWREKLPVSDRVKLATLALVKQKGRANGGLVLCDYAEPGEEARTMYRYVVKWRKATKQNSTKHQGRSNNVEEVRGSNLNG
jgi:hypothetical protein